MKFLYHPFGYFTESLNYTMTVQNITGHTIACYIRLYNPLDLCNNSSEMPSSAVMSDMVKVTSEDEQEVGCSAYVASCVILLLAALSTDCFHIKVLTVSSICSAWHVYL